MGIDFESNKDMAVKALKVLYPSFLNHYNKLDDVEQEMEAMLYSTLETYPQDKVKVAIVRAKERYEPSYGRPWPDAKYIVSCLHVGDRSAFKIMHGPGKYAHIRDPLYLSAIELVKQHKITCSALLKELLLKLSITASKACSMLSNKDKLIFSDHTFKEWQRIQSEIYDEVIPTINFFEKRGWLEIKRAYVD